MKKLYALSLILLVASCSNSVNTSETKSDNVSMSSEELISNTSENKEESSNVIYEDTTFYSCGDELYLHVNETYALNKMALLYSNQFGVLITSENTEILSVDNAVLKGVSLGETTIYATKAGKRQTIQIHVVDDAEDYGSMNSSIDIGRLYNKDVIFFGDSITHNWAKYPNGDTSLENDTTSLGYNHIPLLNEKCNFSSITNAAWSGGTMATFLDAEHPKYKSFSYCAEHNEEGVKKADYAFIWYGTNDLTAQIQIGSLLDNPSSCEDVSSFLGGMKYGINKIREYNPSITIFVLNVMNRSYPYYGSIQLSDYNDAIERACLSLSLRHVNMNALFRTDEFSQSSTDDDYSNDGLHPNDKGYKKITDYLLNNGVLK